MHHHFHSGSNTCKRYTILIASLWNRALLHLSCSTKRNLRTYLPCRSLVLFAYDLPKQIVTFRVIQAGLWHGKGGAIWVILVELQNTFAEYW
jgi:hypothetical protein